MSKIHISNPHIQNALIGDDGTQFNLGSSNLVSGQLAKGAESMDDAEIRASLSKVISEVEKLRAQLPAAQRTAVTQQVERLSAAVQSDKPDRHLLELSGAGLVESAKACAEMVEPVTLAVKALLALFGGP